MEVSFFDGWWQLALTLQYAAIAIFVYMTTWYLIALALKRNDVADLAWGLGFVIVGSVALWFNQGEMYVKVFERMSLVWTLVALWGLRLAWHIFQRLRKHGEDARYKLWRDTWKLFYLRSYLQVFLLQGVFMFLITMPILFIHTYSGRGLMWLDFVGLAVWLIGYYFEVVGDRQLRSFITNPDNKGKLMTSGLWRYTRHPNYFGEITMWWGIWIIALSVPFGWASIIGPLTISWLLLFVSGVPLAERSTSQKTGWAEYAAKTNAVFPWWPRA